MTVPPVFRSPGVETLAIVPAGEAAASRLADLLGFAANRTGQKRARSLPYADRMTNVPRSREHVAHFVGRVQPVSQFLAVLGFSLILAVRATAQSASPQPQPGKLQSDGLIHVDGQTRLAYISRAQLWHAVTLDDLDTRSGGQLGRSKTIPNDAIVECDYAYEGSLGGTTPKFRCINPKITLADGTPVVTTLNNLKVRYNNLKTFSTVISTRLAWALGFTADTETPVAKVICHGCSSDPFKQKSPARGDATFTQASVAQHFPSVGIYGEGLHYSHDDGEPAPAWYWSELKLITDKDRADQASALELFAAFLKHGDSKAVQNRLVCLEDLDASGICTTPVIYVHDFGNTLGSDGMRVNPLDLKRWQGSEVWKDDRQCVANLHMNAFNGSGLSSPEITEGGRKLLAGLLNDLVHNHPQKLRDIFDAAHIERFDDNGFHYSADAWVRVFTARADQIINHAPCPR